MLAVSLQESPQQPLGEFAGETTLPSTCSPSEVIHTLVSSGISPRLGLVVFVEVPFLLLLQLPI